VSELTESVTDTHRQTHTGKFIFCPCIALDRQRDQQQQQQQPRLAGEAVLLWMDKANSRIESNTAVATAAYYILAAASQVYIPTPVTSWLWRWRSWLQHLPL